MYKHCKTVFNKSICYLIPILYATTTIHTGEDEADYLELPPLPIPPHTLPSDSTNMSLAFCILMHGKVARVKVCMCIIVFMRVVAARAVISLSRSVCVSVRVSESSNSVFSYIRVYLCVCV